MQHALPRRHRGLKFTWRCRLGAMAAEAGPWDAVAFSFYTIDFKPQTR